MKRLSKATGFVSAVVVLLFVGLCLVTTNCYIPGKPPLTTVWIQQFGTTGKDVAKAIAIDATGVYVAGFTDGTFPGQSYYGGASDAFVRKYHLGKDKLWEQQFGTNGAEGVETIAVDATGVYMAGLTSGVFPGQSSAGWPDGFVCKYHCTDGIELWTTQFGTSQAEWLYGIALDATGVYVAGLTLGSFSGQQNVSYEDVYVCKYHYATGIESAPPQQFGTPNTEEKCDIAMDGTGVYVAGSTWGTFPGQKPIGLRDGFICNYDSAGNPKCITQFGTDSKDMVTAIAIYGNEIYVAGYTDGAFRKQKNAGGQDGFIRKFDLNGGELWTKQFGTKYLDWPEAIAVDATGVYVAGFTDGTFSGQKSAGGRDGFVCKYDLKGKPQWTMHVGTNVDDWLYDIALDATGVYVAGSTTGTFLGQSYYGGSSDAFAIKFKK